MVVSNIVFWFLPLLVEDEPILTFAYFSDGVGSTTNHVFLFFFGGVFGVEVFVFHPKISGSFG